MRRATARPADCPSGRRAHQQVPGHLGYRLADAVPEHDKKLRRIQQQGQQRFERRPVWQQVPDGISGAQP